MKYKVGDRVRIKSLDWYNENKNEYGNVNCSLYVFSATMRQYCGTIHTIRSVDNFDKKYKMVEDGCHFDWTDEMIEGLVEEEVGLVDSLSSRWVNEFELPDGYIFKDENGNVINATKIVLEKKKKEYPKTYEECAKLLNTYCGSIGGYNWKLLSYFQQLLIARDAYWKLYGEEMGLGKPWEPDWKNSEEKRYCIVNIEGDINLPEKVLTKWILKVTNKILVFPTEEMRDAFKENFDPDIEICKELL